jgi:hypothetical protein
MTVTVNSHSHVHGHGIFILAKSNEEERIPTLLRPAYRRGPDMSTWQIPDGHAKSHFGFAYNQPAFILTLHTVCNSPSSIMNNLAI